MIERAGAGAGAGMAQVWRRYGAGAVWRGRRYGAGTLGPQGQFRGTALSILPQKPCLSKSWCHWHIAWTVNGIPQTLGLSSRYNVNGAITTAQYTQLFRTTVHAFPTAPWHMWFYITLVGGGGEKEREAMNIFKPILCNTSSCTYWTATKQYLIKRKSVTAPGSVL